jgi:hypothetical protein
MSCPSCPPQIEKYGADPANVQWVVVRGDTATLKVEFWENDETTQFDTDGWVFEASAYDSVTDTTYELEVTPVENYVIITALPADTDDWGSGAGSVVAELSFDLEVTIPAEGSGVEDTVWTPVIGTICVLGDITGGSL